MIRLPLLCMWSRFALSVMVFPALVSAQAPTAPACAAVTVSGSTFVRIIGSEASRHKFQWDSDGFALEGDKPYINLLHSQWDQGTLKVRAVDQETKEVACEVAVEMAAPKPTDLGSDTGLYTFQQVGEKAAARVDLRNQLNTLVATKDTDHGLLITVDDVFFNNGKSDLKPQAKKKIAGVSDIIKEYPDLKLQVASSTEGSVTSQKLAKDRATSTESALISTGVEPANVTTTASAEYKMHLDSPTAAGKQGNHTVVMFVSGESIGSSVTPVMASHITNSPHVTVFFETERKPSATGEIFADVRDPDLKVHYGSLSIGVSAPQHPQGIAGLWSSDSRAFDHSPQTPMVDSSAFLAALARQKVGTDTAKQVLLYIHGFNNGFDEAVNKAAQLVADTGFNGVPVVFDWPAREAKSASQLLTTYPIDRISVDSSFGHLAALITQLVGQYGNGNVHIVAHSLGNRVLMNALTALLVSGRPLGLGQVILAAPDLDATLFTIDVQQLLVGGNALGVTLYGSQKDKAMWASNNMNHEWPVGGLHPISPIKGIVQVDATAVSANFVGHDYFVSAPAAVADIALVLGSPYKAPPRSLVSADFNGYTYWQLQR